MVNGNTISSHRASDIKTYLEQTNLNIQRKTVERHGTDEGYSGGHSVHYLKVSVQPQALQFAENVQSLKFFKVENLGVWKPELFDEGNIHGDPGIRLILWR